MKKRLFLNGKIENIPGVFKVKSRKRHGKFVKTGLNNCSISKSLKGGTEPGCPAKMEFYYSATESL